MCVLVAQWCLTLCDLMDCSLPGSCVHGILQVRILEWVAAIHSFLQGIFPTQGSNLGLPHCRQILHHLSHQGSPSLSAFHAKPLRNSNTISSFSLDVLFFLHRWDNSWKSSRPSAAQEPASTWR